MSKQDRAAERRRAADARARDLIAKARSQALRQAADRPSLSAFVRSSLDTDQMIMGPMWSETRSGRIIAALRVIAEPHYPEHECRTLRAIAGIYRDRPGYDQAWALDEG